MSLSPSSFARRVVAPAAVMLLGATSVASAHPKGAPIVWQSNVEATLQPGDSQLVTVTLTARQRLPAMGVTVSRQLRRYVTAQDSTVGPLAPGQTAVVTLRLHAPTDALPSDICGSVDLRLSRPKRSIPPPAPPPLPIRLAIVWPSSGAMPGGISFSYSGLGQTSTVSSVLTPSGIAYNVISIQEPTSGEMVPQYAVNVIPNPTALGLSAWFAATVDVTGAILGAGQHETRAMENGFEAIELRGELPVQHLDASGPTPDLFAAVTNGDRIVVIQTMQGSSLGALGFNPEQRWSLYEAILESVVLR